MALKLVSLSDAATEADLQETFDFARRVLDPSLPSPHPQGRSYEHEGQLGTAWSIPADGIENFWSKFERSEFVELHDGRWWRPRP